MRFFALLNEEVILIDTLFRWRFHDEGAKNGSAAAANGLTSAS
jgi:hypothetical protein